MVVTLLTFNTTDIVSDVSYNSAALTEIGQETHTGAGTTVYQYCLQKPTTGTNNLVVNLASSDSPQLRIATHNGIECPPETSESSQISPDDVTYSTTLSATLDDSIFITSSGDSSCDSANTAGTDTYIRSYSSCTLHADSGLIPTGSATLTINRGANSSFYWVSAMYPPLSTTPTSSPPVLPGFATNFLLASSTCTTVGTQTTCYYNYTTTSPIQVTSDDLIFLLSIITFFLSTMWFGFFFQPFKKT